MRGSFVLPRDWCRLTLMLLDYSLAPDIAPPIRPKHGPVVVRGILTLVGSTSLF